MYYSFSYHIYEEIDNISIAGTCITVGVKFNWNLNKDLCFA